MTGIRFENPPAGGRGSQADHKEAAQELRNRPGEWALVAVYRSTSAAASIAYSIRKGRIEAYQPAGAFEAISRTVNGERRVYAQYVGAAE